MRWARLCSRAAPALVAVAACASEAHAQSVPRPRELEHDLPIDGALTATTLGFVILSEERKADLAPTRCRWCDRDGAGNDTLNALDRGARRALRWRDPRWAARLSDVTAFLLSPGAGYGTLAGAAFHDRAEASYPVDTLLVLEAFAFAELANEVGKYAAARERPFVHASLAAGEGREPDPDDNLSFYSGHTSIAFSVATASGTIASLRGYRLAPVVWAAALPFAALTGYLRIAADKHSLTDVLAGAVLGSAFGVLVPVLFHGRREGTVPPVGGTAAPASLPTLSFGGVF